jgi:hypothetical protein
LAKLSETIKRRMEKDIFPHFSLNFVYNLRGKMAFAIAEIKFFARFKLKHSLINGRAKNFMKRPAPLFRAYVGRVSRTQLPFFPRLISFKFILLKENPKRPKKAGMNSNALKVTVCALLIYTCFSLVV